jgi:hypothetical protein
MRAAIMGEDVSTIIPIKSNPLPGDRNPPPDPRPRAPTTEGSKQNSKATVSISQSRRTSIHDFCPAHEAS